MKQCCASGASNPMPSTDINQLARSIERAIPEAFVRTSDINVNVTTTETASQLEQAAAEYRQASAADRAMQQADRALEQAGRAIFDARRELEKANGGSIFGSYSEVSARAHQRLVDAAIGAGK